MSAFIPNPEHIGLLAVAITKKYGLSEDSPADVAEQLAEAVIEAVATRYPDSVSGSRPGPRMTDENIVKASRLYAERYSEQAYTDEFPAVNVSDVYNMARCYEDQACKMENWRQHPRDALIRRLERTCLADLATGGPYSKSNVPWEFTDERPFPEVDVLYITDDQGQKAAEVEEVVKAEGAAEEEVPPYFFILYSNTSRNSPAGLRPQVMLAAREAIINGASWELDRSGEFFEDLAGVGFLEDDEGDIRPGRELTQAEILALSIKKLGDDGRLYEAYPTTPAGAADFLEAAAAYGLTERARNLIDVFNL
jgi:hypothetical protein